MKKARISKNGVMFIQLPRCIYCRRQLCRWSHVPFCHPRCIGQPLAGPDYESAELAEKSATVS